MVGALGGGVGVWVGVWVVGIGGGGVSGRGWERWW